MDLLFGFSGRIGRLQWWLAQLAILVLFALSIALIAFVAGDKFSASDATDGISQAGVSVLLIIGAVILLATWINIACTVKRFHDRNKSGYWFLIVFVPYIGALRQIVECGFVSGSRGGNNYGPPSGSGGNYEYLAADLAGEDPRPEQPKRTAAAVQPATATRQPSQQARRSTPGGFGRRGTS